MGLFDNDYDLISRNLNITSVTKSRIEEITDGLQFQVKEGIISAQEAVLMGKMLYEFGAAIKNKVTDLAVDELEKLHADERIFRGVKMEVASTAERLDYSHDHVWSELQSQLEDIKDKIKSREELMKTAMKHSEIFDADGIQVLPAKVKTPSGKTIRITLPK